jgi:hypothetical protein
MALLKIKSTAVVPKVCVITAAVINAANILKLKQDILITSGNDAGGTNEHLHVEYDPN